MGSHHTSPGSGALRGRCSKVSGLPCSLKTATLYSLGKEGAILLDFLFRS